LLLKKKKIHIACSRDKIIVLDTKTDIKNDI